MNICKTD